MKTKPIWKPGDRVMLDHGRQKEYGFVVATHWDPKMQWWDCRVVFFGYKKPKFSEIAEPYMLRYLETSLKAWK